LVLIYQTTRHHISEDSKLYIHCHENIKSDQLKIYDSDIINNMSVVPGYSSGQDPSLLTPVPYHRLLMESDIAAWPLYDQLPTYELHF
jgi:hypothetical protein